MLPNNIHMKYLWTLKKLFKRTGSRICVYGSLRLFNNSVVRSENAVSSNSCMYSEKDENIASISESMHVYPNFVSKEEEKSLLDELEPYLKRLRYEYDHWDNAIHGFRETEKSRWKQSNAALIKRIKDFAFLSDVDKIPSIHILDLSEDGVIKPHIDSERFCGDTIAGLSLLSDSVMRLVNDKDKSQFIDVLLKQRSLYVMKGIARYQYSHEILADENSIFCGKIVRKSRRISVICRNEPKS